MADINLKLLRTFEAVSRHRSFTRAAAELQRSQATVSTQVGALEAQLCIPLLERTTRRVSLTRAGESLAEALAPAFRLIEEGLLNAREQSDRQRGRLVIACVPSLASVILPAMLADHRRRDPDTRIDVEELSSTEMLEAVTEGAVDFGIGPVARQSLGVTFTAAVDEPLYVLLQASEIVDEARELPFKTLATLPLITLSGSVLLQQQLQETAEAGGVSLRSHSEVRHVQTAIAMVQAGVGAAIVPVFALPPAIGGELRALPIADPSLSRSIGIVARTGIPLSPPGARLARHIRSSLVRRAANARLSLEDQ